MLRRKKTTDNDAFLMARIVEHTPLCIAITKTDGIILFVNSMFASTLGYGRNSYLATSIEQYLADREGDSVWSAVQKSTTRNHPFTGKVSLTSFKALEIDCHLNVFKIKGSDSEHALIFIFRDITQEVTITHELEHKNLELARVNSELIRSNSELKRVSDLKSNFLSIASHELKTPLTSIKGYSDIIIENLKDKIDAHVYQMVECINRASNRLHKIVNNILDVTRIDQKRLRLNPEDMAIETVVQASIEELDHFCEERKIKFKCYFDKNLPLFYGDKLRIQQMFANLFSNALKYSPDNSVVEVTMAIERENRDFHIIVKDHGIGIDKNEQSRIFDPFYEVGSAFKHFTSPSKFMGGGSGLGLSIVKGIVERHGGKIWVVSKGASQSEMFGSEFHVLLPTVARINWNDDETKLLQTNNELKSGDDGRVAESVEIKPVIIFISEDRETTEISRMILDTAFDIMVADSVQAGLEQSLKSGPSIIIVDSQLSGIDGYRMCRLLRSMEETMHVPIALLSSSTENEDIEKCFSCGADDYIVRPFDARELVEKMWRLFMKKKENLAFSQ